MLQTFFGAFVAIWERDAHGEHRLFGQYHILYIREGDASRAQSPQASLLKCICDCVRIVPVCASGDVLIDLGDKYLRNVPRTAGCYDRVRFNMIYYPVVAVVFALLGYLAHELISRRRVGSAQERANSILDQAYENAEKIKKEFAVQAKEEALQRQVDFEQEVRETRLEIQQREQRILSKEELLDSRMAAVEGREGKLNTDLQGLEGKRQILATREEKVRSAEEEQEATLVRISGMSIQEARDLLIDQVRHVTRREAALLAKEIEEEARKSAEYQAKEIICHAMERYAAEQVSEAAVTFVPLPSDDVKGRIIGREGRNIRAFEAATGIEVIVDDTPEAIILSGFDPIRREIARLALTRLISDGRIHAARIEESVARATVDVEKAIREEGEQAALELDVHGLHAEEIQLLGRLKYRSSYGQNCLQHSKEVAYLASVMAAELGENQKRARRAGLIHDIGKAIDRDIEGSHAEISRDVALKHNEHPDIVHAIEAHHEAVPAQSILAVLLQVADRLSAARPGARRDSLESYIKRLRKLEALANSFEGVSKSYAIQAGREIRVMVEPEMVDDVGTFELASDIARKAKEELEFPGQIQVTVIRETRAVDYAR